MNKNELVSAVAERCNMTKKDAEVVVMATFDAMTEALAQEEKIQLIGFGTFEVKHRAERTGRNPRTKEEMVIPAAKIPSFKAGKALKDLVNGVE